MCEKSTGKYLGFEMKRLMNVVKRRMDTIAIQSGIDNATITHAWVIGYLMKNQETDVFQKDFEQEFSIRKSTVTNILKLMEKNGLIVREPLKRDARLKKITLTTKGLAIHDLMHNSMKETEKELLSGISEEEIAQLLQTIKKMRNNIEKLEEDDKW